MLNKDINVLVVEDEAPIREFIVINLKMSGFIPIEAADGEEAIELAKDNDISVIVLDVMLPKIDGFEVCKRIRTMYPNIAIIMLTAKAQDMDKIMGLELGADDYMIKPFNPMELIARIRALLRRIGVVTIAQETKKNLKTFTINAESKRILKNGVELDLSPREFSLLKTLIENPNKALSRNELFDLAWGENFFGDPKTIDVHIRRVREKIEDVPSQPKFIETVWGYGYIWRDNKG